MEKGKNSNNISSKNSQNDEHIPRTPSKKILTKKDLTKLDEYIQQCLNMFKFVDPKPEFYEATGKEKDLIISHKSTIPDLVIWNKTFNKNECFEEANLKKQNPFPRFQFFLRIKSTKTEKEKKKEKKNEKKEKKNEKKEKNKKKEKKRNNSNNANNLTDSNNNMDLNNNINNNLNNNTNGGNNIKQLIKPEITNLNDLDLNKITDYNPYHKNNPYKKMNMDNNQSKIIPNEIGLSGNSNIVNNSKNPFFSNKPNETQGNKDMNIAINNNQYIQNYSLNNNNKNEVSKLINMNNYPFEYQNNNIYIPAINYYKNQNGWMVIDALNGNLVETPFTSFGLYQYLLVNSKNIKGYKIIDNKFNIKLPGEILFNILSQFFESDIKNNQMQKMIQNINLSEIPDFKANDINMHMNLNQFNINNIDNGFSLNSLNKINTNEYQYNHIQSKLLNNNINNNNSINPNDLNNISDFFSNNNKTNKNNNNLNNMNFYQKNQGQSFNSFSNSNFFNTNNNNNFNPNFDLALNQNNNNNIKQNNNNTIKNKNQNQSLENELFLAENFFNKELSTKNNSQNKNISEQDQDILDDKNDNEEYNNINNLIFTSTKNINSNSKSNFDINDDININEPREFDSNNDYQYDNYNAIFSTYSNENNNEGN